MAIDPITKKYIPGSYVADAAAQKAATAQKKVTPTSTVPTSTTGTGTAGGNVGTTASAPIQANTTAQAARNSMDLARQQAFAAKNTGFDPTKYGLSYKSATPAIPAPAVTPEVKQEPVIEPIPEKKTETPTAIIDKFQSIEPQRIQEVHNNLVDAYTKTPDKFANYDQFKQSFDYYKRNTQQQKVLDDFFKSKATERNATLPSNLATGADTSTMTPEQLLAYNQAQSDKETLDDAKNTMISLMKSIGGFTDTDMDGIADQVENRPVVPDLNDTPEIAAVKSDLVNTYTQMEGIDNQIAQIRQEVIDQYPGIPKSQLEAVIVDRTTKLMNEKNNLIKDANNKEGHIKNYELDQTNTLNEYKLQEDALQSQISQFSTLYGLYQETPEGMASQSLAKYNAENPDLNSKDVKVADMALNQTLDSYFKDYGAIIKRPKAQVVADVKAYAKANGVSLSQALQDNFIAPLQGKEQYKAMLDKAMGLGADWTKLSDTTLFNSKTGQFKTVGSTSSSSSSRGVTGPSYNPVDESDINNGLEILTASYIDGTKGGQCGAFANNYAEELGLGRIFKDPFTQKAEYINSQTPKVGDFAMRDSGAKLADGTPAGHIGIVIGVSGDDILIKDSNGLLDKNGKGTETVATRTVSLSKILAQKGGFFDPTISGDTSNVSGILTDYGVPISYDRSIKNTIPTQLMNSEVEKASLEKNIKSMYEAGIPEDEVALTYMGFNVKGAENKEIAKQLVNVGRMLPEDLASMYVKSISDLMNSGNTNGALVKAEQTAYKFAKSQEGDNWISESTVKTATNRANELASAINNAKGPTIGTFNGTLQNWLGKLKGADAQTVKTEITQMIAKMRNDLSGTAVTPSEEKFLAPLIPSLNDTAANFAVKLNNLKNAPLRQINDIRTTYGLPAMKEAELLDMKQRLGLYSQGTDGTDF